MKSFTTLAFCCLGIVSFSQSTSKKTFIISSSSAAPLLYDHISVIDINANKPVGEIYDLAKKYTTRSNGYRSYTPAEKKNDQETEKNKGTDTRMPMGGSVACMAYDAKSDRLFYIPQQLSELRYIDLKQPEPCFTYLENQSLNLLHSKDDVANQVTRMTIGADGFGYALSNDGEHLVRFSTQETPTIQDLGVLIDNPANTILVRSSCSSWGGDIVGDVNGNLYLVTVHNHIFKISLPSKKCDYVGTIKKLPEGFSSNGASVDENGDLLVSCGASLGKTFAPLYKINWSTLEAVPAGEKINGLGNISDMASSNLLFQKNTKQKANEASFTQTVEADDNNLPGISIFPNPINHGRFQVRATNMKEKGEYKMILLDVSGKPILEGKMNVGVKTSTHTFNFPSQHAKGVYFIQIADVFNRTVYSQQLIVE
ncbi:MAG: type sorting protein [Sediminibacterium sp.]|nr:type sorting protein [Sediminibacterium sp.]